MNGSIPIFLLASKIPFPQASKRRGGIGPSNNLPERPFTSAGMTGKQGIDMMKNINMLTFLTDVA